MEEFYNSIDSYLISGSFAKYINYDYIGGMFEFTTGSCHNIYLGMCMNYGIPLGILYIVMIFTMWKIAINRTKNMIYLLPFLYLLIRGFGEFGGIIGSSNANLDFLFDIYIISLISIPNINNENKFKNSISVIS
jgi:O-antigen ligase